MLLALLQMFQRSSLSASSLLAGEQLEKLVVTRPELSCATRKKGSSLVGCGAEGGFKSHLCSLLWKITHTLSAMPGESSGF
jgi:hypothetical protein